MMILRKVGLAVLGLSLLSGVGQAQAQTTIFVKPGDTVEIPLPVENANDNGDPGGDTISSMKVIVTGDSAFVSNPTESAAQSIAPGETKTFTPSFVVGPDAVDGQTYTVRLKQVSPDAGIDPDPDDPVSEIEVILMVDKPPPIIRAIEAVNIGAGKEPFVVLGKPRRLHMPPCISAAPAPVNHFENDRPFFAARVRHPSPRPRPLRGTPRRSILALPLYARSLE